MILWKTIGALPGITNGEVPVWNSSTNQWAAGSGGGGFTPGFLALGNMGSAPVAAQSEPITTVTGTFTANAAMTISGMSAGDLMILELLQGAGNNTLTIGGQNVTVNTGAGAPTTIMIAFDGTTAYVVSLGVGVQSVNGQTGAVITLTAALVGAMSSAFALNNIASTNANTANVPMNNFKLTGLLAGSAAGDSVSFSQVPTAYASTGNAGVAFTAGGGVLLSATAPADGNPHAVICCGQEYVTTTTTGGALDITGTDPAGHAISVQAVAAAKPGPSTQLIGTPALLIESGSTVNLTSTALTGGAATLFAEMLIL